MTTVNKLVQEVTSFLNDEESTVLMAFKVSKSQATSTVFGRRGRMQSKPRILAVSAKRNAQSQRLNIRIHVIKSGPPGFQLANNYKLSSLTAIEAVSTDNTGRSVLLVFDQKNHASLPQWTTRTIDDRNQLLVCLLTMSREHLGRLPKVEGIDVVEMALWAQKNAKSLPVANTFGGGDLGVQEEELYTGTVESAAVMQQDLVSKAEEDDMEALLGTYVIGIDEAEAFSERLKRELGALEAANVHAILESQSLVEEVLERLEGAAASTDDMNEWLSVFNVKLRHMREDIQTIEASNNAIEVQAVNNEALMEELERLLERLQTPHQFKETLKSGDFREHVLDRQIQASEWLADCWGRLRPPGLETEYSQLKAVRTRRDEIEELRNLFVRNAVNFLRNHVSKLADALLSDKKKGQLDHRDMHRRLAVYLPLLHSLHALDPSSLATIRGEYSHAVNMVLRRESRELVTELKAAARLAPSNAQPWAADSQGPASAVDGDAAAISDAYAKLLSTFLPHLDQEAGFYAELFCFDLVPSNEGSGNQAEEQKLSQAAHAALTELLGGVQDDFMGILDWGYKQERLSPIALQGLTEDWLVHEAPHFHPYLGQMVQELLGRIRQLFGKHLEEAQVQLEKHNRGVKQSGILSFIPSFAHRAHRMESLVHGSSRELVDLAYTKLVPVMFAVLHKVAQADPHTADAFLLENFAAFQDSTYDLAGRLPSLRHYYQSASEAYEHACAAFIESTVLEQFGNLFEFKAKLQTLLTTVEEGQIQLQPGFNKVDMKRAVKGPLVGIDNGLQEMLQSMQSSVKTLDLLPTLWAKCQTEFLEQYRELEILIPRCYGEDANLPSSSDIADIFASVFAV